MLVVKSYIEIGKENWNNFVLSNSMGWAYHLWDVNIIDWDVKLENKSFAIVESETNDILFIFQMYEGKKPRLITKLFKHIFKKQLPNNKFTYYKKFLRSRWGYVLKDGLSKKQIKTVKQTFEQYIDEYFYEQDLKYLSINLPPLSDYMLENKPLVNPIIHFNFSPAVRYTYLVDLSKPTERMLADCEPTTRNIINKIERLNKYDVIESDGSKDDMNTYIALHQETYQRTKEKTFDNKYFENIFENLIPQKIVRVFFLVDKETSKKIATIAIIQYKNKTAYYWWGYSLNEKETGINKYLLFKVMCTIRESFGNEGYFETGGAWPEVRTGKDKGLNDFKKCFGTYLFPIYKGNYLKIKQ